MFVYLKTPIESTDRVAELIRESNKAALRHLTIWKPTVLFAGDGQKTRRAIAFKRVETG